MSTELRRPDWGVAPLPLLDARRLGRCALARPSVFLARPSSQLAHHSLPVQPHHLRRLGSTDGAAALKFAGLPLASQPARGRPRASSRAPPPRASRRPEQLTRTHL